MKSKQILSIFAILLVSAVFSAEGGGWRDDVLGDGYEMRYCEQDSDYSGAVRSSIVRKLPKEPAAKGVLYIHGFNDYFFSPIWAIDLWTRDMLFMPLTSGNTDVR